MHFELNMTDTLLNREWFHHHISPAKEALFKIPYIYSCYLSNQKLYSVRVPNLIRFSESANKDFKYMMKV